MTLTVLMDAGPWLPVPPAGYGGIETIVATLVPELRKEGVRVVLASAPGSTVPADEYLWPLPEPRFEWIAAPYNQSCGIAHAYMGGVVATLRERDDIDLVHDHVEVVGPAVLGAMGPAAPPTLQTLHWDLRKHCDFYGSYDGAGRVRFAAVSQSQLDRAPANLRAQTIGVVPLAVPTPPEDLHVDPGDHALILSRITCDKGQDIGIRACRSAGVPVVLAGPVAGIDNPETLRRRLADGDPRLAAHPDVRFFLECVEPLLDGEEARWVGTVGGVEKERVLRSARALLVPNRWAEPGATGVVEALWRGVPVVATRLGVLPSLVRDGTTGFLGDTEEDLARGLARIDEIDPDACRAAAAPWTPKEMARAYLTLYDRLLAEAA
jgi:glycosyltransferase involved in cell wall biosynthesis